MDRQYIRENQVIERYLAGALTADEEQAFEEAYLGDAQLLDELQAAERLGDGIKALSSGGRLERLQTPARWRHMLSSPQYAAAASALLVVSLAFSGVLYQANRALREEGLETTVARARLVPLFSTRGEDEESRISAPAADEMIVLQLDAGIVEYDTYRATLERRTGATSEEIWSSVGLEPIQGEISIALLGNALQPGSYEVRLDGRNDGSPADRYEEISRTRFSIVARD